MKCTNSFNCDGFMILKSEFVPGPSKDGQFTTYPDSKKYPPDNPLGRIYPKGDVFVAAHKMPVFAQCCECGWAPLPEDQPDAVQSILKEFNRHNDVR